MLTRESLRLQIDTEDKAIKEAQLLLNSAATPERLKEELRLEIVRRRQVKDFAAKALQNMDGHI
jgi:hypothetical protein